ncbi:MAG: 6-pyruvoyl-tetrahydropterin synthase-related protein [Candidatus Woesearchaeota archaeon]
MIIIRVNKISKETIISLLVLLSMTIFLFFYFTPDMLFNNHIPTGGDYGSHLILGHYARENLWNGNLIGLYPDWMAGMPMFQFYFMLPYVMSALLSYIIPFNIAFKIISVLGIFLLPLFVYLSLRILKFRFPIPIMGAISSLFLLFDGTYSVWGGNIKSTLAGQFSYSISLTILILFLGMLFYGMKEKKYPIWNIILFSLILLSHLYTFIIACFIMIINLVYAIIKKDAEGIKYLVKVGGIAFLLTAFWSIPFVAKLPWSSAPKDIWFGWKIFSLIFKEQFIVAYILGFFALFFFTFGILHYFGIIQGIDRTDKSLKNRLNKEKKREKGKKSRKDEKSIKSKKTNKSKKNTVKRKSIRLNADKIIKGKLGIDPEIESFFYLLAVFLVLFAFTIIISETRLLNIRFIPFINLLFFIFASIGLTKLLFWEKVKSYLPIALLIISIMIIVPTSQDISSWTKWNFEGLENKGDYGNFYDIVNFLKDDQFNGRIQFEYSKNYNSMGTPRVFESSPIYHGKPVIEALLLESCLTFPYHYYMHKEMSEDAWWPGFNITMPDINLEKGIKDLRLYNVKRYVASTKKINGMIKNDSGLEMEKVFTKNNFNIYSINEDSEYVEVLENEPILVITDDWKKFSFKWFDIQDKDVFLVFKARLEDKDKERFSQIFIDTDENSVDDIEPLYEFAKEVDGCDIDYEINEKEDISIRTGCLNKPLLIKYSYYPNWKVKGADEVYLVSPNLMLIFPNEKNVELKYRKTFSDIFGGMLGIVGLVILIYLIVNYYHKRWKK